MTVADEAIFRRENAALARVLRRALETAGAVMPRAATGDPLQILDLACGTCREAETLIRLFREMRQSPDGRPAPVRFVGADIRERELDEAALRTKAATLPDAECEFFIADCSKAGRHAELGGDVDVTFLRHQNFWHSPAVWRRIFDRGLEKLKDDGLLVITSYFDREHELATAALTMAGAELLVTERNEASRALMATPGKSVDRHVAIFRKRGMAKRVRVLRQRKSPRKEIEPQAPWSARSLLPLSGGTACCAGGAEHDLPLMPPFEG